METVDATSVPYTSLIYEPAHFIEVYLPKRAEYQGALYRSLVNGLEVKNVRRHFSDESKKPRIKKFLNEFAINLYTDDLAETFPKIFYGYSMYEVDGVFSGPRGKIIEERTQVVRLIFRIDCRSAVKEFKLGHLHAIQFALREAHRPWEPRSGIISSDQYERALDWIDRHRYLCGLFVFGYFVFEVCEHLGILDSPEDEIWVTSLSPMRVNRFVRTPSLAQKAKKPRVKREK